MFFGCAPSLGWGGRIGDGARSIRAMMPRRATGAAMGGAAISSQSFGKSTMMRLASWILPPMYLSGGIGNGALGKRHALHSAMDRNGLPAKSKRCDAGYRPAPLLLCGKSRFMERRHSGNCPKLGVDEIGRARRRRGLALATLSVARDDFADGVPRRPDAFMYAGPLRRPAALGDWRAAAFGRGRFSARRA